MKDGPDTGLSLGARTGRNRQFWRSTGHRENGLEWFSGKFFNLIPMEITNLFFIGTSPFLVVGEVPMRRLNSGIKNRNNFFVWAFFLLGKLELIQLIKLILGISKFWSNSLGIRFWKFYKIFENAWVASICVGVWFSKSPRVFNFLRWSILYIK